MIRALITAAVLALSTLTASAAPDNADGLPYTAVDGLQGRHLYNGHFGDPHMGYALHVIRSNYGHIVDVITKGKPLGKYGKTLNADNGAKTTLMQLPAPQGTRHLLKQTSSTACRHRRAPTLRYWALRGIRVLPVSRRLSFRK